MLEPLFNKVAGLKTCKFIKKRLQHRSFSCETFEKHLFYRTPLVATLVTNASALVLLHIRIGNFDWDESHEKKGGGGGGGLICYI